MSNAARDRAEELFHNLQNRARDLVDAEEGLVRTVRDLVEEKGLAPNDVKKRLDDVVGRLKANKFWESIRTSDAVVALSDYRDEFETRVEEAVQRFMSTLQLVTKTDVAGLEKELESLRRKVGNLKKQITKLQQPEA